MIIIISVAIFCVAGVMLVVMTSFLNNSTENRSAASSGRMDDVQIKPNFQTLGQIDFSQFYLRYSGFSTVEPEFGAYALQPLGDSLYIGLSGGKPISGGDGALLLKYQNEELLPLPVLNSGGNPKVTEQGIHTLKIADNQSRLIIPGSDPCCDDNWDFGNVYTHQTNTDYLQKFRHTSGLDHVVHFWGIAETPTGLYGAVSSYFAGLGDWGTAGEIFKSVNGGQSWQRVTADPQSLINSPQDLLSSYRISDIAWFNNLLYIVNGREGSSNQPAVQFSSDMGTTWQRLTGLTGEQNPRLQVFNNVLVGVQQGRQALFVIDQNNQAQLVPITYQGRIKSIADTFQVFATGQDTLFVLTQDSWVLKTTNPLGGNWELVAILEKQPIAITYWPARDNLIIATKGDRGTILEIDPWTSITPPPVPTSIPSQCLPCNNAQYDHDGNGLVDQNDIQWFVANCLGQPISLSCPNFNQQSSVFTSGDILCAVNCSGTNIAPKNDPPIGPTLRPIKPPINNPTVTGVTTKTTPTITFMKTTPTPTWSSPTEPKFDQEELEAMGL